jgi:Flp pilus assembly protein TadG
MRQSSTQRAKRRGTVIVMTLFLSMALLAMMAFSIDIGYAVAVKSELQNAADAAALAAAQQLQTYFVNYYMPGQTQQQTIYNNAISDMTTSTAPIPTAQRFAGYNQAGNVSVTVPEYDITFSYYDGTTFSSPTYPNYFPNTVNVTTRRDSLANGPLGLFFARLLGINTVELTATASATIYAGDVMSLNAIPGVNAHILPVALDVHVWMNYQQGNFSSDWLNGLISDGPNNAKQLQVYPFNTNTPGSFGLLDVGLPANNVPAFRTWIDNGETPNDVSYLLSNQMLPVSVTVPEPWKVGPGLNNTLVNNFGQEAGVPNLIPLFMPVTPSTLSATTPGSNYVAATAQGQNATYAIVGFAGVTVTQATGNGNSNLSICIQPCGVVDPTAVFSKVSPARAAQPTQFNTSQTTFVSAKLTR